MPDPLAQLLYDPRPDPLADERRRDQVRRLLASLVTDVTSGVSEHETQDQVDRRVRRAKVQAVVLDAYEATVAEQEIVRLRPDAFNQAWRTRLAARLDRATIPARYWGELVTADLDTALAWLLYELASRARLRILKDVRTTADQSLPAGPADVPVFEFLITSDDRTGRVEFGSVKYGVCPPCRGGLLYKISISTEWQFCGLGRRALGHLENRYPGVTWHTSGQFKDARGFYERIRETSRSPWTDDRRPCPHFDVRPTRRPRTP